MAVWGGNSQDGWDNIPLAVFNFTAFGPFHPVFIHGVAEVLSDSIVSKQY